MRKKIFFISTILLIITAVIIGVVFSTADERRIKKQYDLGYKYLQEMDYEQAIASFNAIIEIDPLNVDAYIGMADAYIGLGDYDSAIQILETGYKALEAVGDTDGMVKLSEKLDVISIGTIDESSIADIIEPTDDAPVIQIKQILDLSKIKGDSIKNWTIQRLIDEFGLSKTSEQYDSSKIRWVDSNGKYYCIVDKEDSSRGLFYQVDIDSSGMFIQEDYILSFEPVSSDYYIWYEERLLTHSANIQNSDGCYSGYVRENDVINVKTFLNSIGISDEIIDLQRIPVENFKTGRDVYLEDIAFTEMYSDIGEVVTVTYSPSTCIGVSGGTELYGEMCMIKGETFGINIIDDEEKLYIQVHYISKDKNR